MADEKSTLQIGKEVLDLSDLVVDKLNEAKIDQNSLAPYQVLLSMAFYDARSFLQSIILLGEHQLGTQAELLLRSMFEMYATIKFLELNREYVARYMSYGLYLRKCRIEDLGHFYKPPFIDRK